MKGVGANKSVGGPQENKMGVWIFLGILIAISIVFPPLGIIIIPLILMSILVGWAMRSVAGTIAAPITNGMGQSAERIAQAIERSNAEAWASQYNDVEINEDGNLRVIDEEEPETDYNTVKTSTSAPKKKSKKKKPQAKKPKKEKKEEELPKAEDLIKDIEDELFGKNR